MAKTIGIILINEGSPSAPTEAEVKAYGKEMLLNKFVAPFQRLSWLVKVYSGILSKYTSIELNRLSAIWGEKGSPIIESTVSLAHELESRLSGDGATVYVRAAMVFGSPSIRDVLSDLRMDQCEKVIALPLFPQASRSRTEAARDLFQQALKRMRWQVESVFIDDYHDNQVYARIIASSIEHAGFRESEGDRLLMAYRAIPLEDIEKGDMYELQAGTSSLTIAGELGLERKTWSIAFFRNDYDGREYLEPHAIDAITRWARVCSGRTFVVCPGYATECTQTYAYARHNLKKRYIEARREEHPESVNPAEEYVYVPCLGKTRAHLRVLTDVLAPYLTEISDEG